MRRRNQVIIRNGNPAEGAEKHRGGFFYCQITLMTGMLIAGKMSVGVRRSTNGVSNTSTIAATTKV